MWDDPRHYRINFLVMNVLESFFQLNIDKKKLFDLGSNVPWYFIDKDRLMVANDNKAEFTGEKHKATDLQEALEGVLKTHDISKDEWFKIDYDQKQIFGEPNDVSLKF